MNRLSLCLAIALCPLSVAAEPRFTDVTVPAGVDYVQFEIPDPPPAAEFPFMTGGAAAGDFDGDGWIDLFVTRWDRTDILFRNRGDGTFENVTAAAGLTLNAPTNGAAWGDIDNDGDLDLYVTAAGSNQTRFYLFVNDGAGRFTEQAIARGAAVDGSDRHHGFSVAFGDYDLDGWLDIHTAEWRLDGQNPTRAPSNARLLRNRGGDAPGHFEDVTVAARVALDHVPSFSSGTFAFASDFSDLDGDGWPELIISGDFGTSRLFWNNGDGTFTDGTEAAGVGSDENGMGCALGDYDGDGRIDWFVTSIYDPEDWCSILPCGWGATGNRLFGNLGDRSFEDRTDAVGVRDGYWGWGTAFLDYDNDGDQDLVMTNGIRFPAVGLPWLQQIQQRFTHDPMRLWRNDDAGAMTEVSAASGLTSDGSGKGLLTFDYDRDGDLDIFVVNNGGHPALYRNDGGNDNRWLRVQVLGERTNRQGIGTRVELRATPRGPVQVREIRGGSHFLGQSETVAHFGLGPGPPRSVFEVRVIFPASGKTIVHRGLRPGRTVEINEAGGPRSIRAATPRWAGPVPPAGPEISTGSSGRPD